MKKQNLMEMSSRKFAGTLPNISQPKHERNFNKAHLKAYLKGHRVFTFGKDLDGIPKRHRTLIINRVTKIIESSMKKN